MRETLNATACAALLDDVTWSDPSLLASLSVLAAINVMVIVGNCLVIAAVFCSSKLRSVTNLFIVSLAVADLLVGVAVLPFSATWEIFKARVSLTIWSLRLPCFSLIFLIPCTTFGVLLLKLKLFCFWSNRTCMFASPSLRFTTCFSCSQFSASYLLAVALDAPLLLLLIHPLGHALMWSWCAPHKQNLLCVMLYA